MVASFAPEPVNGRQQLRRTVVTVLPPVVRGRLDAAIDGVCTATHTDSVRGAIGAVRDNSAQAVLLSPMLVEPASLSVLRRLVANSSGAMTIAVVSEHGPGTNLLLLDLGACGVRRVVDVTDRDGWNKLRHMLRDANNDVASVILEQITSMIGDMTPEMRRLCEHLVRSAPGVTTVRALIRLLPAHPGSVTSRFVRAGLPSPKRYLVGIRLIYAAAFLENPRVTIATVAYRLHFTSAQSLGRHVRCELGITPTEFRRRYSLASALDRFMASLIVPFTATLQSLDPIGLASSSVRLKQPRPYYLHGPRGKAQHAMHATTAVERGRCAKDRIPRGARDEYPAATEPEASASGFSKV